MEWALFPNPSFPDLHAGVAEGILVEPELRERVVVTQGMDQCLQRDSRCGSAGGVLELRQYFSGQDLTFSILKGGQPRTCDHEIFSLVIIYIQRKGG